MMLIKITSHNGNT